MGVEHQRAWRPGDCRIGRTPAVRPRHSGVGRSAARREQGPGPRGRSRLSAYVEPGRVPSQRRSRRRGDRRQRDHSDPARLEDESDRSNGAGPARQLGGMRLSELWRLRRSLQCAAIVHRRLWFAALRSELVELIETLREMSEPHATPERPDPQTVASLLEKRCRAHHVVPHVTAVRH